MILEDIRSYLKAVARRPSEPAVEAVQEALAQLKRDAVAADDRHRPRVFGVWNKHSRSKSTTCEHLRN
jgi:hypothetical protein